VYSAGSEYSPVVGRCEHGCEPYHFNKKAWELAD
jgi:hypothetical protein